MHFKNNIGQKMVGKWEGSGKIVDRPQAPPLKITFEVEYVPSMKPFYFVKQYAYNQNNGKLLTAESGVLRVKEGGHHELLFGQPQGVTEICEGVAEENKVVLKSTKIERTSTATEPYVLAITRTYAFEEDGLHVIFDMGTTLNPEVHPHLHHILKRVESS